MESELIMSGNCCPSQALREAEAEFYMFDSISALPFVQICSDLNRGGVAYYTTGADVQGTKFVWRQVLHGMQAVYIFLAELLRAIPSNVWLVQPDEQVSHLTLTTCALQCATSSRPEGCCAKINVHMKCSGGLVTKRYCIMPHADAT